MKQSERDKNVAHARLWELYAGCIGRLVSGVEGQEIQCGTPDPFGVVQFCHACNVALHQGTMVLRGEATEKL